MKKKEINLVTLSLDINSKQSLFILLGKDGAINRIGSGTIKNKDKTLFIDNVEKKFLQRLMKFVPFDWSKLQGIYRIDIPDKKGKNCELQVLFKDEYNKDYGFVVTYGSRSEGPPNDIREFIINAVQITQPWFDEQKQILKQRIKHQSKNKSWWKF